MDLLQFLFGLLFVVHVGIMIWLFHSIDLPRFLSGVLRSAYQEPHLVPEVVVNLRLGSIHLPSLPRFLSGVLRSAYQELHLVPEVVLNLCLGLLLPE